MCTPSQTHPAFLTASAAGHNLKRIAAVQSYNYIYRRAVPDQYLFIVTPLTRGPLRGSLLTSGGYVVNEIIVERSCSEIRFRLVWDKPAE